MIQRIQPYLYSHNRLIDQLAAAWSQPETFVKMSTIFGDEHVNDVLDKWYKATNRKQITLVTAGRSSVGKSTLIGNMLRLKGDAAPKGQHGPSSTTAEVKVYTSTINGVEVRIIDTPGLAAKDMNEAKVIAELQEESKGEADMLLYCISLLPDSIIDEQDEKIIKVLKVAFGSNIWSHAILVLTFANYVIRDLEEGKTFSGLVQEYAAKFQLILQSKCPSFSVISILSCPQNQEKRDPSTITALPAGRNPSEELVKGMKWDESIYVEALKKCNPDAIPALLKVREPSAMIIRLGMQIGGYLSQSRDGGVRLGLGVLTGTVVGGILGGGVGMLAGGKRGIRPGLDIGGKIGYASACGLGMLLETMASVVDVEEYEEEQAELEKIQREIKQRKRSSRENANNT